MEEVRGAVRSSLTSPPPASSPTIVLDTALVLPAQPPLGIVDEKPSTGIEGDLEVESA